MKIYQFFDKNSNFFTSIWQTAIKYAKIHASDYYYFFHVSYLQKSNFMLQ